MLLGLGAGLLLVGTIVVWSVEQKSAHGVRSKPSAVGTAETVAPVAEPAIAQELSGASRKLIAAEASQSETAGAPVAPVDSTQASDSPVPSPAMLEIARACARGIEFDEELAPVKKARLLAAMRRTDQDLLDARTDLDEERGRIIKDRIERGLYKKLVPGPLGGVSAGGDKGKFLVHVTFLPDQTPISITLDHGEEPALEDLNKYVGGILEGREREALEILEERK